MLKTNSPQCIKSTAQNNKNNKYINNNYNNYQKKNQRCNERDYPPGFLEKLYANKP